MGEGEVDEYGDESHGQKGSGPQGMGSLEENDKSQRRRSRFCIETKLLFGYWM